MKLERERNKRYTSGKEVNFIFTDDMIVYVENSKESAKNLNQQELLSEFSKYTGWKINIKVILISITYNKFEIRNIIYNSTKLKWLGINVAKHMKYLYVGYYKTLIKEVNRNLHYWGPIMDEWVLSLNIVKMSVLSDIFLNTMQSQPKYQQVFLQLSTN